MHLAQILRYPVKSLSKEELRTCRLSPGQGLPFDRHWALARPDGDALNNPGWMPKSHFLVLVREHAMALAKSRFDEASGRFCFEAPNGLHAEGKLSTEDGRKAIASAMAKHLGLDQSGVPTLVEAQDIGYFDTTKGPISILNLESLRALEKLVSQTIDPVRFRMNLIVEGCEAWSETHWPGKRLKIGECVLEITENTGRCKATHVNPDTGELDVKILHALKEHYGHTQMGVYAVVVEGGAIKVGDTMSLVD
ncbi:MOSC domain-containing protein [Magnetovibrio sp.]|uniref:MOSC domain-containing protein n=1 Tax=Magnetovibrio sp. TaxID=2024836 RepID=UPI002F94D32D